MIAGRQHAKVCSTMRKSLILFICILPVLSASQGDPVAVAMERSPAAGDDSLKSVVNAFVALYCKENMSWKKDVRVTSTPREVPPGRQVGLSTYVGYYTFIPKTWDDLTPAQRAQVLADPRFKAFVISLAHPADYPVGAAAHSTAPKAEGFNPTQPAFPVTGRGPCQQVSIK